jgi:NTE family protein
VPAALPRGRTPIDVLVASLGVAMRVRPEPDLGPAVSIHRMTTPDLGARMTDFSYTARHIADGRAAAERLLEQLAPVPEEPTLEVASRMGAPIPDLGNEAA